MPVCYSLIEFSIWQPLACIVDHVLFVSSVGARMQGLLLLNKIFTIENGGRPHVVSTVQCTFRMYLILALVRRLRVLCHESLDYLKAAPHIKIRGKTE